jgi:DNA primase
MAHNVATAPSTRALVIAHYERAAQYIAESFPLAPVVRTYYPDGLGTEATYSGVLHEAVPEGIATVEVGDPANPHRYVAVERDSLFWLAQGGAIGFESWTPSPRDPESVGYARITLRPRGGATQEHLAFAMLGLRTILLNAGAEAIPVLNGVDGATLFVPFSDVPTYESVRAWLHGIANLAVQHNPTLCTTDMHDHVSQRIHVNVSSNAVGHFSSLPYALIGTKELGIVMPIRWRELGTVKNGDFHAGNGDERFAEGNLFQRLAADIGNQRFSGVVS